MHTTLCDENKKSLRQMEVLITLSGFLIVAFNTKCFECMIFFSQQSFPKKLPMSQSVPQIYIQVKEFIYASLKFSESLHRR